MTPRRALVLGLTGLGVFAAATTVLMTAGVYEVWTAMLIAPVLVVLSVPVLSRAAARDGDRLLFWVLVAALLLKLLGSVVRYYVIVDVYGGADATAYHNYGTDVATAFRAGRISEGIDIAGSFHSPGDPASATGSRFIPLLTGLVYTMTGPTMLGGFLLFSWIGYWGLYLFHRAFQIALPGARSRMYTLLVLFLPSMLFWPSSIGKEAWMLLMLGVTAYGAAVAFGGRAVRGLSIAITGVALASVVRVHIGAVAGLALGLGVLFVRWPPRWREAAPVAKGLTVAVFATISFVLVTQTPTFLKDQGFGVPGGVVSAAESVAEITAKGGSEFEPSVVRSPFDLPAATFTVLFRPHILEAETAFMMISGLESLFLLTLGLVRVPSALAAFRSRPSRAYLILALVFAGIFVVGFSTFANFGLLARQRTQVLPFFLVLISSRGPANDASE